MPRYDDDDNNEDDEGGDDDTLDKVGYRMRIEARDKAAGKIVSILSASYDRRNNIGSPASFADRS